jgi:hypothetical protein
MGFSKIDRRYQCANYQSTSLMTATEVSGCVTLPRSIPTNLWTLEDGPYKNLCCRLGYYTTQRKISSENAKQSNLFAVNETHNPYSKVSTGRLPDGVFSASQKSSRAVQQASTWTRIIEDYSGRKLNVPEDRLPALAGLVRELQTIWKNNYVAGMWQKCLVRHLGSRHFQRKPITAYESPGWSWVSREGKVFILDMFLEDAEVLDVAVNLFDENIAFGQVCNERLVLRASVLPSGVKTSLGHYSMDFLPDGLQNIDDDTKFVLLGYSTKMIPIGLILRPAGDAVFMRVGLVIGWNLNGAKP